MTHFKLSVIHIWLVLIISLTFEYQLALDKLRLARIPAADRATPCQVCVIYMQGGRIFAADHTVGMIIEEI